ncbi:MAG: glycosyltransferase family 2 protein [Saprospiraceae bacterium]|nr:glycosyltransferase family 2 protein [Saprospiraceae bacterium]
MKNPALVSIITINFRDASITCALLDSLAHHDYPNIEVIIVDNGSLEDKTEQFQRHYPTVNVLISKENRGFAGGNNLGIQAAKGDFLFFVNNDTIFEDGLIQNCLDAFTTPDIGVIAPKIRYFNYPDIIQYAGFTEVNPLTARGFTIGDKEKDLGQYDERKEVPYAHGAAMMLKREVVEKIGEMPDLYFLYYEELDWCVQIRRLGYKIMFEPSAVILHKESMSVGKMSALKTFYLTRNRILFMRRTAKWYHLVLFSLFFILVTFPRWVITYLLKREWDHLKAFVRASLWNIGIGKASF